MTHYPIESLWSQNNFQIEPSSMANTLTGWYRLIIVIMTISRQYIYVPSPRFICHEVAETYSWDVYSLCYCLRCLCYCSRVSKKYQVMLKLLGGEDFLKWLKLACKAGDAILVASKKTNVTILEILVQYCNLGQWPRLWPIIQ